MKIDLSRFSETFFDEAAEHLVTMEAALLRLEAAPEDPELLNEVFRAAHSMKGGSATLGLVDITEMTHALENLLDCIRSRGLRATPLLIDILLRARDVVSSLVTAARTRGPAPAEKDAVRAELERALEAANAHRPAASATAAERPDTEPTLFAISFAPNADLFRRGIDPLLLLRELAGLGGLLMARPNLAALPALADLDPASCYLSWAILLRTEQPRSAVESVFEFVRDCCRLSIESISGPPSPGEGQRSPFFGAFLVENGFATPEQVLDAIDRQRRHRPMLGRLAIDSGKMTAAQVFDTLNQMGTLGLRFGEAAVRLGHLSEVDLAQLRLRQSQFMPLGEALVEAGVLPREHLAPVLEAFHKGPAPGAPASAPPCRAGGNARGPPAGGRVEALEP